MMGSWRGSTKNKGINYAPNCLHDHFWPRSRDDLTSHMHSMWYNHKKVHNLYGSEIECFEKVLLSIYSGFLLDMYFFWILILGTIFFQFQWEVHGASITQCFKISYANLSSYNSKRLDFCQLGTTWFCVKVSDWIFLAGNEMTSLFHPT